ncbi:MAG: hypothetical protein G01um101425_776 [Candidatus Peregrinibacteria bacterium Gr01-1014_25]|nr:MAG: hypothetical protein G01um101425_776 [Candidatus Peregrinibacteria bacterium Gr01-1014_25]
MYRGAPPGHASHSSVVSDMQPSETQRHSRGSSVYHVQRSPSPQNFSPLFSWLNSQSSLNALISPSPQKAIYELQEEDDTENEEEVEDEEDVEDVEEAEENCDEIAEDAGDDGPDDCWEDVPGVVLQQQSPLFPSHASAAPLQFCGPHAPTAMHWVFGGHCVPPVVTLDVIPPPSTPLLTPPAAPPSPPAIRPWDNTLLPPPPAPLTPPALDVVPAAPPQTPSMQAIPGQQLAKSGPHAAPWNPQRSSSTICPGAAPCPPQNTRANTPMSRPAATICKTR